MGSVEHRCWEQAAGKSVAAQPSVLVPGSCRLRKGRSGTFQVPFPPAVASGLLLNHHSAAIESPGITPWR